MKFFRKKKTDSKSEAHAQAGVKTTAKAQRTTEPDMVNELPECMIDGRHLQIVSRSHNIGDKFAGDHRRLSNRSSVTSRSCISEVSSVLHRTEASYSTAATEHETEPESKDTLATRLDYQHPRSSSSLDTCSKLDRPDPKPSTMMSKQASAELGSEIIVQRTRQPSDYQYDSSMTMDGRLRPQGKAPEDPVSVPHDPTHSLAIDGTTPRPYQVKLQKPKNLQEMLHVGSGQLSITSPSTPASAHSSIVSVSGLSQKSSQSSTLPARYVPFEPIAPGASESKVKFYRAPAHYSDKMKLDNPDLGMKLHQPRPIGAYKTAQLKSSASFVWDNQTTIGSQRIPLGPRTMTDVAVNIPRPFMPRSFTTNDVRQSRRPVMTRSLTPDVAVTLSGTKRI